MKQRVQLRLSEDYWGTLKVEWQDAEFELSIQGGDLNRDSDFRLVRVFFPMTEGGLPRNGGFGGWPNARNVIRYQPNR